MVISAGVGKAAKTSIKQTDTATDIADRLADTRALRALSRMSDAKEAGKARAAARILLASDDATEAVISQADTAGQAVRLWRIQRGTDLDVDSLSEADQSKIGDFLVRNGDDGAQVVADGGDDAIAVIRRFDRVDDDTADRLADLKRSGDLDTSDLNRLENALDTGEIDGQDLRRVSKLYDSETGEYYVGSNTEVEDILDIPHKGGDLDKTEAVIVRDGSVRWLQEGSRTRGWQKIQRKHVYGDLDTSDSKSSFFETGQSIELGGRTVTLDSARSVTGVKRLVIRR